MNISIEVIKEDKGFQALKSEWNRILSISNSNNIFLTWEWLYTWWECFKDNKQLLLIIARMEKEIVGIAPLYIVNSRFFGLLSRRHIEFIGSTGTCSEYLDFIIQKGKEKAVMCAILDELMNNFNIKWEILNLSSILTDSDNLKCIREFARKKGLKCRLYGSRLSPFITLPATSDEFYSTVRGKRIKMFLRSRKRISEEKKVSYQIADNKVNLANEFEEFIKIHQKRQMSKGNLGSFVASRKKYNRFHKKIINLFFDNGWLYFISLNINGSLAAVQYNYLYNNKVYCYSVGFNPDWRKFHVGSVLQTIVIEDAIRKTLSEYDFLRGTEEYKYYWTDKHRESIDLAFWKSATTYSMTKAEMMLRNVFKYFLPQKSSEIFYDRFLSRKEEVGD